MVFRVVRRTKSSVKTISHIITSRFSQQRAEPSRLYVYQLERLAEIVMNDYVLNCVGEKDRGFLIRGGGEVWERNSRQIFREVAVIQMPQIKIV